LPCQATSAHARVPDCTLGDRHGAQPETHPPCLDFHDVTGGLNERKHLKMVFRSVADSLSLNSGRTGGPQDRGPGRRAGEGLAHFCVKPRAAGQTLDPASARGLLVGGSAPLEARPEIFDHWSNRGTPLYPPCVSTAFVHLGHMAFEVRVCGLAPPDVEGGPPEFRHLLHHRTPLPRRM
jgi:hypothetical protein